MDLQANLKHPNVMDAADAGMPSKMRMQRESTLIVESSKSYLLFFQKLLHGSICCSNAEVLPDKDHAKRLGPYLFMLQKMNSNKYPVTFKSLPE